jgi:hypothetical protein
LPTPTAYVCSYPKSGRTWVRFVLFNYLRGLHQLSLENDLMAMFRLLPNVEPLERGKDVSVYAFGSRPEVPLIAFSHLHPDVGPFADRPVLLLLRDPYDVAVSRFFHVTRHQLSYEGTMAQFIRDSGEGIADLIGYLNAWAAALDGPRVRVVSYEHLRSAPLEGFSTLLRFLGTEIEEPLLEQSLAAASIDRMRSIEKSNPINTRGYDLSDPEALRVRRAIVGGYQEYLGEPDLTFLAERLATELSPGANAMLEVAGASANGQAAGATFTRNSPFTLPAQ